MECTAKGVTPIPPTLFVHLHPVTGHQCRVIVLLSDSAETVIMIARAALRTRVGVMSDMVRGADGVKVEDHRGRTYSTLFCSCCYAIHHRLVIRRYAFCFLVIEPRQCSILLRVRRYRNLARFLGLTVEW